MNTSSLVGVGVSLSSLTIDTIAARHNGHWCSCDAHVMQKPLNVCDTKCKGYLWVTVTVNENFTQQRRLTCAYMDRVERSPSHQSTTYTSPRVRSFCAIAPGIDDVAGRFYPDLSWWRANWSCRRRDSLAGIWMVRSRNWIDTVGMTCMTRPQRIHPCKIITRAKWEL